MKFHHIKLETRCFSFEAYSWNEAGALLALRAGLKRHAMQYGKPPMDFADEIMASHDYTMREVSLGDAYCDDTLLVKGDE